CVGPEDGEAGAAWRWTGGSAPAGAPDRSGAPAPASEGRWADGECVGPEDGEAGAAWRWTGGSAPAGAPDRSGAPVPGVAEGRLADREGAASPPGAGGGVTLATAR
ncbi:hypothetical protein ACFWHD_34695, partial [Streptomyces sp. NPDC060275]